jgi:hypothetical protein
MDKQIKMEDEDTCKELNGIGYTLAQSVLLRSNKMELAGGGIGSTNKLKHRAMFWAR